MQSGVYSAFRPNVSNSRIYQVRFPDGTRKLWRMRHSPFSVLFWGKPVIFLNEDSTIELEIKYSWRHPTPSEFSRETVYENGKKLVEIVVKTKPFQGPHSFEVLDVDLQQTYLIDQWLHHLGHTRNNGLATAEKEIVIYCHGPVVCFESVPQSIAIALEYIRNTLDF